MGEDTIKWWEDLIRSNIEEFEKEVNPRGIPYPPPNIWPSKVLEDILKKAYCRGNPQAAPPNPLPAPAIDFLTLQLNQIFNGRGRGGDNEPRQPTQLRAWMTQRFPGDSAWNPVDVVQHDTGGSLAPGRFSDINAARTIPEIQKAESSSAPRPIPKESYKSDDTTLPFASRSGGSSIGTGVGISSRPAPGNSTPNKPTRGEGEIGHSSRRGSRGRTRAGIRRGSEPTSPSSSKRSRGVHACSQCHKTFPFPSKLKDHMHIHEETKDFSCGVGSCSKAFKRLRELQAHRKTHGEIPLEPRNVDKEMHDSVGQSPADPEPPDPGLPNKSPQDSKSPAKSPPGEAFHKESLSTPPRKSPSITHGESPALPTMPKSPEHSGVSQEPQGDDEKSKDDRRVPLENPGEYLTRVAAGLVGS